MMQPRANHRCVADIVRNTYSTSAPEHVLHVERVASVVDVRAQGELVRLEKDHIPQIPRAHY